MIRFRMQSVNHPLKNKLIYAKNYQIQFMLSRKWTVELEENNSASIEDDLVNNQIPAGWCQIESAVILFCFSFL